MIIRKVLSVGERYSYPFRIDSVQRLTDTFDSSITQFKRATGVNTHRYHLGHPGRRGRSYQFSYTQHNSQTSQKTFAHKLSKHFESHSALGRIKFYKYYRQLNNEEVSPEIVLHLMITDALNGRHRDLERLFRLIEKIAAHHNIGIQYDALFRDIFTPQLPDKPLCENRIRVLLYLVNTHKVNPNQALSYSKQHQHNETCQTSHRRCPYFETIKFSFYDFLKTTSPGKTTEFTDLLPTLTALSTDALNGLFQALLPLNEEAVKIKVSDYIETYGEDIFEPLFNFLDSREEALPDSLIHLYVYLAKKLDKNIICTLIKHPRLSVDSIVQILDYLDKQRKPLPQGHLFFKVENFHLLDKYFQVHTKSRQVINGLLDSFGQKDTCRFASLYSAANEAGYTDLARLFKTTLRNSLAFFFKVNYSRYSAHFINFDVAIFKQLITIFDPETVPFFKIDITRHNSNLPPIYRDLLDQGEIDVANYILAHLVDIVGAPQRMQARHLFFNETYTHFVSLKSAQPLQAAIDFGFCGEDINFAGLENLIVKLLESYNPLTRKFNRELQYSGDDECLSDRAISPSPAYSPNDPEIKALLHGILVEFLQHPDNTCTDLSRLSNLLCPHNSYQPTAPFVTRQDVIGLIDAHNLQNRYPEFYKQILYHPRSSARYIELLQSDFDRFFPVILEEVPLIGIKNRYSSDRVEGTWSEADLTDLIRCIFDCLSSLGASQHLDSFVETLAQMYHIDLDAPEASQCNTDGKPDRTKRTSYIYPWDMAAMIKPLLDPSRMETSPKLRSLYTGLMYRSAHLDYIKERIAKNNDDFSTETLIEMIICYETRVTEYSLRRNSWDNLPIPTLIFEHI